MLCSCVDAFLTLLGGGGFIPFAKPDVPLRFTPPTVSGDGLGVAVVCPCAEAVGLGAAAATDLGAPREAPRDVGTTKAVLGAAASSTGVTAAGTCAAAGLGAARVAAGLVSAGVGPCAAGGLGAAAVALDVVVIGGAGAMLEVSAFIAVAVAVLAATGDKGPVGAAMMISGSSRALTGVDAGAVACRNAPAGKVLVAGIGKREEDFLAAFERRAVSGVVVGCVGVAVAAEAARAVLTTLREE